MGLSLLVIELAGVVLFSASGALLGIQKHLDLFGVLILGVITALGGGLIRDILIGRTPPIMFTNRTYLYLSTSSALLVFAVVHLTHKAYGKNKGRLYTLFIICDAIGLGAYAAIGTQVGFDTGYGSNPYLCICLGAITCVGGGALRDMMCKLIPTILWDHIYALAAAVGSASYYFAAHLGLNQALSSVIGILITVAIRLLSWKYHWKLPRLTPEAQNEPNEITK